MSDDSTVGDLLHDRRTPEDAVLASEWPAEPHSTAVLSRLADDELAVARIWAASSPCTWLEAATAAQVPDPRAMALRVQRKLRRLGKEYLRRNELSATLLDEAPHTRGTATCQGAA